MWRLKEKVHRWVWGIFLTIILNLLQISLRNNLNKIHKNLKRRQRKRVCCVGNDFVVCGIL